MYLVYGSTEYNKEIHAVCTVCLQFYKEIHAVIGTNVLSVYNKEIHAVIGTNVLSVWVNRI